MKKMSSEQYYDLINNSTYIGNLNQGNVVDPTRWKHLKN